MLDNNKRISRSASLGRRRTVLAVCLAALTIIPAGAVGQGRKGGATVAPERLKKAVGCLVAAEFVQEHGLKPLGLKANDWAWVRYHVGSVPDMSPTPGEFYVVVYSTDGQRGALLLAIPNNQGGFEAVRNGYQLTKQGSRWTADEGNGGYIVYEAMERFVTQLSRSPRYRVQLLPGGPGCTQDGK